jgi:hypothetical protein
MYSGAAGTVGIEAAAKAEDDERGARAAAPTFSLLVSVAEPTPTDAVLLSFCVLKTGKME